MAAPDEYTEVRAMVAMRDGVMLATDVYLPSGPLQPLPTILIRTPCEWGHHQFHAGHLGHLLGADQPAHGAPRAAGPGPPSFTAGSF